MYPAPRLVSLRNRRMEQQLNRRHDATNRTFSLGQLILTKDYCDGVEKWTAGCILQQNDQVTYEVEVQSSIRVGHASHLRPSFQPVTVPYSRVIPLDILLDTFDLPQDASAATPNPPSICTPRRWRDRFRRQVMHMQVNPRQQSYEQ
ncbi:hypothetical protein PHET_12101 [Paragonimus heterotremus]|uniref:Uncharacterized protein n=1 Tax=Paragonimus heterotremus TaxID=100268 RepID=A0A8J4WCB5_9TREM|nr:hypothetical protein PHET_12101 [Paragonimus heterotremus]